MDVFVIVLIGVAVLFLDDRVDSGTDRFAVQVSVREGVDRFAVVYTEVDTGAEVLDTGDIAADGLVGIRARVFCDFPYICRFHQIQLVKGFVLQRVISVERIAATVMSDVGKIGEAGKACGRQRQSGGYDGNEKRSATFYQ